MVTYLVGGNGLYKEVKIVACNSKDLQSSKNANGFTNGELLGIHCNRHLAGTIIVPIFASSNKAECFNYINTVFPGSKGWKLIDKCNNIRTKSK